MARSLVITRFWGPFEYLIDEVLVRHLHYKTTVAEARGIIEMDLAIHDLEEVVSNRNDRAMWVMLHKMGDLHSLDVKDIH